MAAGHFNFLKTGILHADFITAVSRTFAREIQTPEDGFGLDGLLRARGDRLIGIVNGVDYGEWDPEIDPHLFYHYSARDLSGKWNCKRTLLRETGLDERTAAPVIGIVSRLTPQKGFDLCFEVLPEILARRDLRLVALGSGEKIYEDFFQALHERFPGKAWFYKGFNNELAHRIEAGADIFLMPSKFEPCGLNQLYSLKYGTPPDRPQDRRPRRHRRALRLRHRPGHRLSSSITSPPPACAGPSTTPSTPTPTAPPGKN